MNNFPTSEFEWVNMPRWQLMYEQKNWQMEKIRPFKFPPLHTSWET